MRLGLLLIPFLACGAAVAAPVTRIVDAPTATTLRIADGRTLLLDGLLTPSADDDGDAPDADRAVAAAKAFLLREAVGRTATLARLIDGQDRWGRIPTDVRLTGDAVWLQTRMLAAGHARVDACPRGDPARLARLRAAEAEARDARRGLWALKTYWPRTPRPRLGAGVFVTVEGVPVAAGGGRRQRYLNFGADWRQDFTLAAPREVLRDLRNAELEFDTLVGRNLRMRGWLIYWNGPMIRIACPQQIEVLVE